MLLAVADYLPRTCRVQRSSFVTFLVQAKELHKRGSSLATRGLPVTYTSCLNTSHSYFRFASSRGALVSPMCRLPSASFCVALGAGASSFPWSVGVFDPRTVQPVAQSLYRLSYPAHCKHVCHLLFYIRKPSTSPRGTFVCRVRFSQQIRIIFSNSISLSN